MKKINLFILILVPFILLSGCNQPNNEDDRKTDALVQNTDTSKNVEKEGTEDAISNTDEQEDDITGQELKVRPEEEVWEELHKMANTKIVAEEIWGRIEITEEKCDELIKEVSLSSYSHKEEMLRMLNNWKADDFRNAVAEHNYVWELLGGTIGKAYDLNEETKIAMAARFSDDLAQTE